MSKKLVSVVAVAFVSFALVTPNLFADNQDTVSAEEETDVLAEELLNTVSAVTASVTPENAAELSDAVTEFLATQDQYRLIGTEEPLGADSANLDKFERRALRRAYRKGVMTQKVVNGELRTVIPLTFSQSDASAGCATCHGNYNDLVDDPSETIVVGAASFRVALD